jgi:cytosine/adenosine deaminase-related metal-dependent hydrolase
VIQAATASGAKTLGIFPSLGSLTSGKLADFIVYPPGIDLLEGNVSHKTLELRLVARGGRIWDAEMMVEVWPVKGRKQGMPVFNAE